MLATSLPDQDGQDAQGAGRAECARRLQRNIPTQLRQLPQFVLYRREPAPTLQDPGRTTKTPYIANTQGPLRKAATTRRKEWRSFDVAVAACLSRGDVDGIGFVLSADDPFTGIDLDHCIDPETGELADWARAIVDSFASYAEGSPSGTGVHIFMQARMPDRQDADGKILSQAGRKCGPIEAYSTARYLTLTGEHLDGTPRTIEARQAELDRFLAAYLPSSREQSAVRETRRDGAFTPPAVTLDDQALLARIKASQQAAAFDALYRGDVGDRRSESEARMALLSMLAWWTKDVDQIDRLFRVSGRDQMKWDRLGQYEIAKALALVGADGYDPSGGPHGASMTTAQGAAARGGVTDSREATDAGGREHEAQPVGGYQETEGGLYRIKLGKLDEGTGAAPREAIALTNFTARIVGDIIRDDGAETSREFEMEARLCLGQRGAQRFMLPAERFSAMTWPTEYLGAGAVVYPNQQQYARTAIQLLSAAPDGIPARHVYTHTGWREIGGEWLYLHTGGAIGATGARPDVSVTLDGTLARYRLPDPGAEEDVTPGALRAAIRVSLEMLNGVAPDEVIFPLYGAIWRAALGGADFTLHVTGGTGAGKTQLAALAQQHYGAEMDAKRLPGSWSSTGNALEAMAFHAKDAIAVVDDFVASGTLADVARMHRDADRLLRGQGNGLGRARMRADSSLRLPMPPRGLVVSTGEDIPRGHSLRARILMVELAPGALDWDRLTLCQRDADVGKYALAMAGFVQWMAGRYDELRAEMRPAAIRERASGWVGWNTSTQGRHRRTSDATAQTYAALEIFMRYAREVQAITQAEAGSLLDRAGKALERIAATQMESQAQSDPVTRFLTLLSSAIASGVAHVASKEHGDVNPAATSRWGWRLESRGAGESATSEWRPQGRRVGWADGDDLYLDPDAAFVAAQALGAPSGDPLTITSGTLWKRLKDRGLLRSTTPAAQTLKARVTCDGQRRWVIHLSADTLSEQGTHAIDQARGQIRDQVRDDASTSVGNDAPGSLPVRNPANPATAVGNGRRAALVEARSAEGGWVCGLDSGASGWVSEANPASASVESLGVGEQVAGLAGLSLHERVSARPDDHVGALERLAGLAGFSDGTQPASEKPSRKTQPTACIRPTDCARRTLASGRSACGLCDEQYPHAFTAPLGL